MNSTNISQILDEVKTTLNSDPRFLQTDGVQEESLKQIVKGQGVAYGESNDRRGKWKQKADTTHNCASH